MTVCQLYAKYIRQRGNVKRGTQKSRQQPVSYTHLDVYKRQLLLSMVYKLLLPAMPAYLMAKIPSGKLTASLRRMPISTHIMLVLIVMLRVAPTVLHEFGEVREAMKIRGFLKSVGNVLRSLFKFLAKF